MKAIIKSILLFLLIIYTKNVYAQFDPPWVCDWFTNTGWIAGWHFDVNDRYLAGSFSFTSRVPFQVLAINPLDGWSAILRYSLGSQQWSVDWANSSGQIGDWNTNQNDHYLTMFGASTPYYLLIAINNDSYPVRIMRIMQFTGSTWTTLYYENDGWMNQWSLAPDDKYYTGQFYSLCSEDQILSIRPSTGWAMLQVYLPYANDWIEYWHNQGNHYIGDYYIRPDGTDNFLVGSFDGSSVCLLISNHITGYASILRLNPNTINWEDIWNNNSNHQIGGWVIDPYTTYNAYDFDMNGKDDFFATSYSTNWSTIKDYTPTTFWPDLFTNHGSGSINGWVTSIYDKRLTNLGVWDGPPYRYFMPLNGNTHCAGLYRHTYSPPTQDVVSLNLPTNFFLAQNYPNPFNSSTEISFNVPKQSNVKIILYDVLGREIKTLINEYKMTGTYNINFDASHLSSGLYFYKMYADNFTDTKKMIITK